MTVAKPGPTERMAWTAAALSVVASGMFVLGALVGDPSALTVLAAAMTGLSGGVWAGRAMEAQAVRTGRNRLRL